eukprot:11022251-Ditylum_brightwellii.AAC.1
MPTDESIMESKNEHKFGINHQEGSNGDREMISTFLLVVFKAWDITVSDLLSGNVTLDMFH